ncbi:hypothetical protein [Vibrio diabolicus]|uniref:Methyl-accepting chemotaxis protein n=1 Tax=Vibrio diabolicus TaxID=50719 RepID=A0AA92R5H4_9VIBR|nr:hypothetical protein [Vibrio diabolicus]QRG81519.1 hypothetical protein JOS67_00180 [Vibrio diabolicus]
MSTINQGVSQQHSQTDLMATAIQEMGHTVEESAGSANQAAEQSISVESDANEGATSVSNTLDNVSLMVQKMENTSTVIQNLATEAQ